MSILLNAFVDIALPIIIIVLAIILSVVLFFFAKKKFSRPLINTPLQKESAPQVKLRKSFCTEYEMRFLEAVHKSLPRDCIAFPNVGISKLIEPKNNLIDYKLVLDKFVDICVFLRKDMQPILVIDLYQSSPIAQQMKKFDDNVVAVLKEIKIPVLHKMIEDSYNTDDLRIELLTAMSSNTVAYLKDKMINNSK